jgi:hypothetical protein
MLLFFFLRFLVLFFFLFPTQAGGSGLRYALQWGMCRSSAWLGKVYSLLVQKDLTVVKYLIQSKATQGEGRAREREMVKNARKGGGWEEVKPDGFYCIRLDLRHERAANKCKGTQFTRFTGTKKHEY